MKERLEPLSEYKEDEAVDKIIEYMMRIYIRRADPILNYPGLRLHLRQRIKEVLPTIDNTRNNILQLIADRLTGELTTDEPTGRYKWGYQDKWNRYQVRKIDSGDEIMVVDSVKRGAWQ